MAYLSDISDQTQQQLGTTTAPPGLNNTAAPIMPAGTGAGSSTGGRTSSPIASPNTASPQTTGTPATNVSTYLEANQPQIQNFGNTITGQLNSQYGQALNDINTAGTNFNNQVTSGYNQYNPEVINQAVSNPAEFVSNPNNVTAWNQQINNAYTGPTQFETQPEFSNLESEIANTQNEATPWTTFQGTESQFQGMGDVTPGQQQLDTALIQGNPSVTQNITTAANQAGTLTPTLNALATQQDQDIQNAQSTAAQSTGGATTALTTAEQQEQDYLNNELASATSSTQQYNADVNTISQVAQSVGQTIDQFLAANPQITVSANNNFLQPWETLQQVNAPTLSNVASANDYAEEQALADLANGTYTTPLNQSTLNQAGTFNLPNQDVITGTISPVTNALQSELESFGNEIQTQYAPYQLAEEEAYDTGTLVPQQNAAQKDVTLDQTNIQNLQQQIATTQNNRTSAETIKNNQDQLTGLQQKLATDQITLDSANSAIAAEEAKTGVPEAQWNNWDVVGPMAQQLAYLPGLATNYNNLLTQLQSELAPINGITVPTYAPSPAAGPLGLSPQEQTKLPNQIATGTSIGIPVTGGIVGGIANTASQTANEAEIGNTALGQSGEGAITSGAPIDASEAATPGIGALPAMEAVPLAAIAAEGASNIAQNIEAKPVQSIAEIMGNTLTLGALSLPPKWLNSIGSDINSAINSVEKFFGNLF